MSSKKKFMYNMVISERDYEYIFIINRELKRLENIDPIRPSECLSQREARHFDIVLDAILNKEKIIEPFRIQVKDNMYRLYVEAKNEQIKEQGRIEEKERNSRKNKCSIQ